MEKSWPFLQICHIEIFPLFSNFVQGEYIFWVIFMIFGLDQKQFLVSGVISSNPMPADIVSCEPTLFFITLL